MGTTGDGDAERWERRGPAETGAAGRDRAGRGGSHPDRDGRADQSAKLPARKSIAKAGAVFHLIDFGLAVKVAFWCNTV